ncbi:MAG: hypothetical protein E7522_09595 [Ruminococcaceae bacterium]|nr:hypothetical protein [Oscillospiraceae bacterium]
MKRLVSFVLFIIVLLNIMTAGACKNEPYEEETTTRPVFTEAVETPEQKAAREAYKKNPLDYVMFSKSTGVREIYFPREEILNYKSQYPQYVGTYFKDQLEGEDLLIYQCYLYAMENFFTGFNLYVENNDRDFSYIRMAFSFDSALLEQNWGIGETEWDWPTDYIGEPIFVKVEHFVQDYWDLRMEAVEKGKQIVADIPKSCDTKLEQMKYLYRYVCDNVEYTDYKDEGIPTYLYDAMCEGKSNCDGYSNMLCLLFKLIDVECYEVSADNVKDNKNPTPEELENPGGHTWVVAKVDGEFYNFDATFEDTKDISVYKNDFMFFGFSDEYVPYKYFNCDEYRPKCTANLKID